MQQITLTIWAILAACVAGSVTAQPDPQQAISELGHRWAYISYQTPEREQQTAFENLNTDAAQIAQALPGHAEPLVWQAIILASTAKVQGGLGALSKVKQARTLLLQAEQIDPTALNGSIYGSLGSLYAKVPGWPIGYGDKGKAAEYFHKALAIDPDSIDANYFYADLLAEQGAYAQAAVHLKKALAAPARPGRADADAGRRQEAIQLLELLKQKHANQLAGA
jgi:tetratricopeptide (TPR) repeat protein